MQAAAQPQRAPDGAPLHYEPHRPEQGQTTLYRLVQQHAASFIAHTEASTGSELPRFVKDEFDAFLACGILAHGFLRLRCGDCGHDKLLAFSCKRRGFCPSCGGRRMSQTAAHLVDHVIPHVPVRQWVLSLPIPLRVLLAAQPELVTPVLQVVQRVIARHLLDAAGLKADDGHGGAVTLIQRFGSAANLNIHLHCLGWGGFLRQSGYATGQLVGAEMQFGQLMFYRRIVRGGILDGAYGGLSLEVGNYSNPLVPGNASGLLKSIAGFVAADSPIGPAYLGYGRAADGTQSFYFYLGRPL